ncbi:MAG: hypothetical protein C5B59_13925 [Bacteroidetes bacterium]|nr:MAG: hypothetical protein C5B59_13925 [Bacteroidota bacterium]
MQFSIHKSILILERTPSILENLTDGLPDEWIYSNEGENTWSPFDVIGHLIHGEKTDWIPRMRIILNDQGDKKFEVFDRFAQFKASEGKSMQDLLSEFRQLRMQNLEVLKTLGLNDSILNRTGIHPALGRVTLRQLIATWVTHDLSHLSQITRVMAKQYKQEIGPWTEYFNIFKTS